MKFSFFLHVTSLRVSAVPRAVFLPFAYPRWPQCQNITECRQTCGMCSLFPFLTDSSLEACYMGRFVSKLNSVCVAGCRQLRNCSTRKRLSWPNALLYVTMNISRRLDLNVSSPRYLDFVSWDVPTFKSPFTPSPKFFHIPGDS